MFAGLGTSVRWRVGEAATEAVQSARRQLGARTPDAALVVATAAWGDAALAELVDAVADRLGHETIAGGSVDGLLAGEGFVSDRPALAVLALAEVDEVAALHAEALTGDETRAGPELAGHLPAPAAPEDLLVLFGDSLGLATRPLLDGMADALAGRSIVGAGASESPGGAGLVWAGREVARSACSALYLRGARRPAIAVTQGCRALGPPLEVTRASGHWLLALDGRPALDVVEACAGRSPIGQADPRGPVLLGLRSGEDENGPLDAPLLRRIVGVDAARRAIGVPDAPSLGSLVSLIELEPASAGRDLETRLGAALTTLDRGRSARPAFGLHLTCRGVGDRLLEAAMQSRLLAHALDGAPLLGLTSAYQIASGPRTRGHTDPDRPGAPRLHTHSGVLVLVA